MKKIALITGITGQDGSFLAEFLLEKGKERNKINLFIGIISQFPVQIVLNFYLAAIEYYIVKYNVFKLSSNNRIILLY